MSSNNMVYNLTRRRFVADQSDRYALKDTNKENSGMAQEFAKRLANTTLDKSGLRGLESLAWSTDSVGDVVDYIRVRVGRDSRGTWSSGGVGQALAKTLEEDLQKDANAFWSEPPTATEKRMLHLDLCREFIKHLVAHFEFAKSGVKV